MSKKIWMQICAGTIAACLGISLFITQPQMIQAKNTSEVIQAETTSENVSVDTTSASMQKEADNRIVNGILVVKKADLATAKIIHDRLYTGKALTLKIKGDAKTAQKCVTKLNQKIGKVSKTGVIFQYKLGKKSGKYYLVNISTDNARLYKYSVLFIKKFVKEEKAHIECLNNGMADLQVYPDQKVCRMRNIYDAMVITFALKYKTDDSVVVQGADLRTTTADATCEKMYDMLSKNSPYYKCIVKEEQTAADGVVTYSLRTYDEFVQMKGVDELLNLVKVYNLPDRCQYLVYQSDFCDLSDAMKIYAFDDSKYFAENESKWGFQMLATNSGKKLSGWKAMKALYQNKAKGNGEVFASYEKLVLQQLGIKSYIRSSKKINRTWLVIKATNAKGKTLWIPFDYGIGPEVHVATDPDRGWYVDPFEEFYELYLSGISGAPSYKNFTQKDFL